jgi:hypothetical protein
VAVIYSPSVALVGTVKDVFITSDSEGALMSSGGLWNISGALYSVPDDMLCVRVMFPSGTELTVNVDAKMFAGLPTAPASHQGVVSFINAAVGTCGILHVAIIYA